MLLTKKALKKILAIALCYFLLGSISITVWAVFNSMGINENFLLILGIIVYLLCGLVFLCGWYAEGKGKLINLGNRLVRNELKPSEFLNEYVTLKNSNNLIVKNPCIEILQLVAIAYDSLDQRENALATVNEMISLASKKKKMFANLFKASLMFSYDKKEEAEALFNETQKQKLDVISKSLVDSILKNDRAMAIGDYKTVEMYNLSMLKQAFPKLDNLGKLVVHYKLGEVYEKLQETDKAITYYRYCADFGGETAIRTSAVEKLQYIH